MDRSNSSASSVSNFSVAASTAASLRSNTRSAISSPSVSTRNAKSVLSDKYMLGEELGRGAYGQVYKGLDTRTGDTVAIKQMSLSGISQENLQSVMGEIDLLKNLNHKNIVKYLGSFKTRTHLYIILEFMENGSLASIIKPTKFGAFPESLVAVYIAQVLQGLAYLHDQGVVHRDIKGANILTTKEGLVKLADFGVAAKLGELEEANNSLRLSVVGTPYWMAPEVIEMTSVTAAADIWSVACLSIELLTGQAPYYDLQPMSALFRIVQDEHPPLPEDISPGMHNMLLQCFNKDPQKRPDARTLLRHPWIQHNRQTLRSSWSRTQGLKARGIRTDAHVSVNSVVERMLAAEAEEAATSVDSLPSPETATSPHLPAPSKQKQGTPVVRKNPSFRDSAMETASVDTAYQPSSSQHGHAQYAPSASPSTSRRPSRHSDSGPSHIRIDIPPTPSVPPSAASSYDSTYYSSVTHADAPPEVLEPVGEAYSEEASKLQAAAQHVPGSQQPTSPHPAAATQPWQQTDARTQSPLGGLMGRLGSQSPDLASPLPAEDLLAWLANKDRQVAPPLQFGIAQTMPQPSASLVEEPSTNFKHQEAAEVRRLVGSMRIVSSRQAAAGSVTARETPVVEACQVLTSLVTESSDRKPVFLAEGGVIAIMELLEERSTKVVLAGLELANALVAGNASVMETMCLVGIVPTVARFAAPAWPRGVRLQAARFVQQLCRTSLATAQMFVACQGLSVLVGLIEDNVTENGKLTGIGVDSIWRVLELHGIGPMNHLCRLLANAGLPHRLMHAMFNLNQEYQTLLSHAEATQDSNARGVKHARSASHPGDMQQAMLGGDPDSDGYPRSASHAYASSRAGSTSSFSPATDFVGSLLSTRGGRPPQAPRSAYRATMGSSRPASPNWGPQAVDVVSGMLQKMGNLLLVLSHADAAVKARLCRNDTLLCQFDLMQAVEPELLLKLLKSLKHLTLDPSTLPALQDAGTIQVLPLYLQRGYSNEVQMEALHAMYNMCKLSKNRQEAAALAGIVPLLVKLATPSPHDAQPPSPSPPQASVHSPAQTDSATSSAGCDDVATVSGRGVYPLRPLAVSLLCGMAHSTHRARHELWAHNVVALLLDLLKEEVWQGPALDALAAWLGEDAVRMEPRLRQQDAVQRFVALFASYSQNADSEALARLLDPFLRIMKRSRKITVEVSLNGMAPLLVQLLKQPNALTALNLLQIVRCMYEQHPRPKEFIVKYSIAEQLKRLAAASSQAVLVRKQAQNLLDAFQLNVVF